MRRLLCTQCIINSQLLVFISSRPHTPNERYIIISLFESQSQENITALLPLSLFLTDVIHIALVFIVYNKAIVGKVTVNWMETIYLPIHGFMFVACVRFVFVV